MSSNMYRVYCILLISWIFPLFNCQNVCSPDEAKNYMSCIESTKTSVKNPWAYRMPYADHEAVSNCFVDIGCDGPDFERGLFVDFVKIWQNSASKLWTDYTSTPEIIKQCLRDIVSKYVRIRLDHCLTDGGGLPLGIYPEDVELPYCMQRMPNAKDLSAMQTGLMAKVNVLQALGVCKEKNETAATLATECVTKIRRDYFVNNSCPISSACLQTNVSQACGSAAQKEKLAICQCARGHRDKTIASIDAQYAAGSVNLLALSPAFLGMEVTSEISTKMKKCYKDNGKKPISMLNVLESQILTGPLFSVKPRPQGIQAIRRLVFSQLDLPDFCEECST